MHCLNCGKELLDNAKFCTYCGAKVIVPESNEHNHNGIKFVAGTCPNCGSQLSIDSSLDKAYCQYCGTEFLVDKEPGTTNFRDVNVDASENKILIKAKTIIGFGNKMNAGKERPVTQYEYLKAQELRKIEEAKAKANKIESITTAIILSLLLITLLVLALLFAYYQSHYAS